MGRSGYQRVAQMAQSTLIAIWGDLDGKRVLWVRVGVRVQRQAFGWKIYASSRRMMPPEVLSGIFWW